MYNEATLTDTVDIEKIVFDYLHEVANELEKRLCFNQNNPGKKFIGIEFFDEKSHIDVECNRIVIPHHSVRPIRLYSELQSIDEGFFWVDWLIKQFEIVILSNENQLIKNKYCFLSEYNQPLSPQEAAIFIYDTTAEIVSGILKDTIGVAFNDIDLLSLTNYESQKAKGTLFFVNTDDESTKLSSACIWAAEERNITFQSNNIKYIRKLLVGCGDGGLLFVKESEQPIPVFLGVIDSTKTKLFPIAIRIYGPLKWALLLNGTEAFRKDFNSIVVKSETTVGDIIAEIKSEFLNKTISEKSLAELITPIYKSNHGSAIILIDGTNTTGAIYKWFLDLKKFKKMIPLSFSDFGTDGSLLDKASAMDGAIVIDVINSKVIALATIVDGKTSVPGDPSRGSRYNSLKNFTYIMAENKEPILSIVFSEDGDKYIFAGKKLLKEFSV